jgi:hypothetical protein
MESSSSLVSIDPFAIVFRLFDISSSLLDVYSGREALFKDSRAIGADFSSARQLKDAPRIIRTAIKEILF